LSGIFKSNYVGIVVFHRLVALTPDLFSNRVRLAQ
jgi:hypothetical protein